MLLTDAQLHEIREIIRDHHTAFVANTISPNAVDPVILERLKEKGFVNVQVNSIEDSYLYGQVLAAMEKYKGMTYEQFKQHMRRNPIALTQIEQHAVDMAQHKAAQYAVGLGNRVDQEVGSILIEADGELRSRMREEIRDATAENIARRESVRKLKSDLGWATRDWARDWDRIAVTEKHSAMQQGQADQIAKRHGEDARVFVRPAPDACDHCKRLYLGPDGNPRIFKLSTLVANGSNFGRKANDYLPVIPPAHPWCRGNLARVPAGWGFDEHGKLSPKGKGGIEYEDSSDLELSMRAEQDLQKAFALQGELEFQGLQIAIENKPGSVRKWTAPDGEGGETHMKFAYGFVRNTEGMDGDEIDVYVGPDPKAKNVYVIHQQNPKTGIWDEDKVFLGFSSQRVAERAYAEHYDRPDFAITTSPMSIEAFKRWIKWTKPDEVLKKGKPTTKLVITGEKLSKGGPYIGPRGGKWADIKHTIPWRDEIPRKQLHEEAHDAVKKQVVEAAHRAVAAGADPKNIKYVGAGMTAIIFKSGDRAYKVSRWPERKETLRNEAEAMQSLEGTPAEKFVAKVHTYDANHDVIVKEMVEGRSGTWGTSGLQDTYRVIEAELAKKEWGHPEYKEDSFIVDETGKNPKMVDVGFVHPRGEREAKWVERVIANAKEPKDINILDMNLSIRNLVIEGHLKPERARAMSEGIVKVKGSTTEVKQFVDELEKLLKEHEPKEKPKPKKDERRARLLQDGYTGPVVADASLSDTESVLKKQQVEHFVAFDASGRMLFRVMGEEDHVKLLPMFTSRLEDTVFTHNHPHNGCLSIEDINLGVVSNVKEIRAVCADGSGTWVLSRPEDGWVQPEDLIGSPSDFYRKLRIAWNTGVEHATKRMDKRIKDAGGTPGDSKHPAFSREVFDGFVAEESFRTFNKYFGQWYGWEIRKEHPSATKHQGRSVQGSRARSKSRRTIRAENQGQLRLFKSIRKLSKAEVPAMIGALASRAADRAPALSSGANYAFHIPVKRRAPVLPDKELRELGLDEEQRIKLPHEVFEVEHLARWWPQKLAIPLDYEGRPGHEQAERNREHLEEIAESRRGDKNQQPVVEK